jgi:hypothetical protein
MPTEDHMEPDQVREAPRNQAVYFVPTTDPASVPADRWLAATGFELLAGPIAPTGPASATEAALHRAASLTTEALQVAELDNAEAKARAANLHILAAELRRESGEWSLCVGNFDALTRHFLKIRNYPLALAYMRRLLVVADHAERAVRIDASMLSAKVYREVRDYASATAMATRAAGLAVAASDAERLTRVGACLGDIHHATEMAPAADAEGSTCVCGSNLSYASCCKRADVAPVEFSVRAVGFTSSAARPVRSPWWSNAHEGIDVFLRRPGDGGETPYWVSHGVDDGRHVLVTLPNWVARAMQSARAMQAYSGDHPEGYEGPTSVVLNVSCALEAFMNAVIHFIGHDDGARFLKTKVSRERFNQGKSKNDGGLADRWVDVAGGLFGQEWIEENRIADLRLFMRLRSSLAHYRDNNIEQIAPSPAKPHRLISDFLSHDDFQFEGAIRPGPAPWVDRLLTEHIGAWSITLADELIAAFRDAWSAEVERSEVDERLGGHEDHEQFAA